MCPHSYYDMIRSDNHKQTLRSQMVHYARQHSVSAAARRSGTTRETVRKWLGRPPARAMPERKRLSLIHI